MGLGLVAMGIYHAGVFYSLIAFLVGSWWHYFQIEPLQKLADIGLGDDTGIIWIGHDER